MSTTATFAFEESIKKELHDAIEHIEYLDMLTITIKKEKLLSVIKILKEHPQLKFEFLTSACGMHFMETSPEVLGMVYMLHNLPQNWRIRIKTYFGLSDAEVDTITPLFPAANWMEREAWDFFGIKFKGHPNLIRILNMEDLPFFPLRKDFALEDPNRDDKNDSMFGR